MELRKPTKQETVQARLEALRARYHAYVSEPELPFMPPDGAA